MSKVITYFIVFIYVFLAAYNIYNATKKKPQTTV